MPTVWHLMGTKLKIFQMDLWIVTLITKRKALSKFCLWLSCLDKGVDIKVSSVITDISRSSLEWQDEGTSVTTLSSWTANSIATGEGGNGCQLNSEMKRDRKRDPYTAFNIGLPLIYTSLCGTTTNLVIIQKLCARNWDKLVLIRVSYFPLT